MSRMRSALNGLDEGTFTEGHELDLRTEKQVPKAMIGHRLSQEEAKRLLAKFVGCTKAAVLTLRSR
jgi:hypothetical protein